MSSVETISYIVSMVLFTSAHSPFPVMSRLPVSNTSYLLYVLSRAKTPRQHVSGVVVLYILSQVSIRTYVVCYPFTCLQAGTPLTSSDGEQMAEGGHVNKSRPVIGCWMRKFISPARRGRLYSSWLLMAGSKNVCYIDDQINSFLILICWTRS